jgi:glycosyltransferase involved in cell wall biosynthesis
LFARADGLVVLTERLRHWLTEDAHLVDGAKPVEVIPCCVDLERFRMSDANRQAARERLNAGDRFVLAYSGTLGSWYCEREMAQLFARLSRKRPSLFAVFSASSTEPLQRELRNQGVGADSIATIRAKPDEMPAFLAAADAAVSFIEPCFSKMASSPTKVAEYLAVGLPVVMNRGVGDSDTLIGAIDAMIDGGRLEPAELDAAVARLLSRRFDARERDAAREAARSHFCLESIGLSRYRSLYHRLAS